MLKTPLTAKIEQPTQLQAFSVPANLSSTCKRLRALRDKLAALPVDRPVRPRRVEEAQHGQACEKFRNYPDPDQACALSKRRCAEMVYPSE